MAFLLSSMKYLIRQRNNLPYFQRKWPKDLLQHPSIKSSLYKVALKVDPNNEEAILRAIKETNKAFDDYCEMLRNANITLLDDLDRERRARQLLKINGFEEGAAATSDEMLNDAVIDRAEHHDAFNDLWNYRNKMWLHHRGELDEALPDWSSAVDIQDRAWKLLKEKPLSVGFIPKTFGEVFAGFWQHGQMTSQNKKHRSIRKIWDEFIALNGGDTSVMARTVNQYLHTYKKERIKTVVPATVERYLSHICTPINEYIESLPIEHQFEYKRPKIPKASYTNQKPPILHEYQQEVLHKVYQSGKDWMLLFVLISLHSGMHPSEATQLKLKHFNFNETLPTVFISGPDADRRKDEARQRVVPLVFSVDMIKHLVLNTNALDELNSKTPDNIGIQTAKILKQVNKEFSAYSLRHTLAHNLKATNVSSLVFSELGGWVSLGRELSEHGGQYAKLGKDALQRLEPRKEALINALAHLEPILP